MSDAPVVENSNWWYKNVKEGAEKVLGCQICERGDYVVLRQNNKVATVPIWLLMEFLSTIQDLHKTINDLQRKIDEDSSNRS